MRLDKAQLRVARECIDFAMEGTAALVLDEIDRRTEALKSMPTVGCSVDRRDELRVLRAWVVRQVRSA